MAKLKTLETDDPDKAFGCTKCDFKAGYQAKIYRHYAKEHEPKKAKPKIPKRSAPSVRREMRPEDRQLEDQVMTRFNFCPNCAAPLPKKVVY